MQSSDPIQSNPIHDGSNPCPTLRVHRAQGFDRDGRKEVFASNAGILLCYFIKTDWTPAVVCGFILHIYIRIHIIQMYQVLDFFHFNSRHDCSSALIDLFFAYNFPGAGRRPWPSSLRTHSRSRDPHVERVNPENRSL